MERSREGMAFLSGHLGAVLQRRLREVSGIALLSLAMVAALALATWSVQDPSLSHATEAPAHNLLGVPGAIAADLLMQLFGLGSLALLLPVAIWGYRLIGHRPLNHERVRVVLWLVGTVLSAAFASCLPRTRIGRCHPGWAASSAMPCCGCRRCSCTGRFGIDQPSLHHGVRARHRRAHSLRGAPRASSGATRPTKMTNEAEEEKDRGRG